MDIKGTLKAEPTGALGAVRLSWQPIKDCIKYHVFFKKENNAYKKINTTHGLSVVVSGVDTSALCHFRVCGIKASGQSVTVGEADNSAMLKQVKFLTIGSYNLERLFNNTPRLTCDRTFRKYSPLSLFFPNPVPEGKLYDDIDLAKSAGEYLASTDADYLLIDFYSAAQSGLVKIGDSFVTGGKDFLDSECYKKNKEQAQIMPQILPEEVAKPLMDIFASRVLSRFTKDKIILVRFALPRYYAVGEHVRISGGNAQLDEYIRMLEELFIKAARPITVDISREYFGDYEASDGSQAVMEKFYFTRLSKILEDITRNGIGAYYDDGEDINIKLDRILYYYDSVSARGFYNTLFEENSAASVIMMRTSREFISENREIIKAIMRRGFTSIKEVLDCCDLSSGREFIKTVNAIYAVECGDLGLSSYTAMMNVQNSCPNIRRPLKKLIADVLKKSLGEDIVVTDRNTAFMLKAAYDLLKGDTIQSVAQNAQMYLKLCAQTPVDVWGSCVSREPLNRSVNVCVNKYIFKNSPVWAFDKPINTDDGFFGHAELFGGEWRRRLTEEVFLRKAPEIIKSSIGKWIIVDFYDLCSQMARYRGGCFAVDNFVKRSPYFAQIHGEVELFSLDAEKDRSLIMSAAERMAILLSEVYGDRIILNRVHLNTEYRDLDGNIKPLADTAKRRENAQSAIALCEEYFAKLTDCYVLDITKHCISDDSFILGGAHIAHYEEIYYLAAAAYIDYIVKERPPQRVFDKL